MDPNAALRNLLDAALRWEDTVGAHEGAHIDAGGDMRDAVMALNEWLSWGGFLPQAWEPGDGVRLVVLSPADVTDLAEVLGDAYAYRNDSSDSDEEPDVEGRARVGRLERRLGVNASY